MAYEEKVKYKAYRILFDGEEVHPTVKEGPLWIQKIREEKAPIEWVDFCSLIKWFKAAYGPLYFDAAARHSVESDTYTYIRSFMGALTGPVGLYKVMSKYVGPSMMPNVVGEVVDVAHGGIVDMRVEVLAPWWGDECFFELNSYMMKYMPLLAGYEASKISWSFSGNVCRYVIGVHQSRSLYSRATNALYSLVNGNRIMVDELSSHLNSLREQHEMLKVEKANVDAARKEVEYVKSMYERAVSSVQDGLWSLKVSGADLSVTDNWSNIVKIDSQSSDKWRDWVRSIEGRVVDGYGIELLVGMSGAFDFTYEMRSSEGLSFIRVRGGRGAEYVSGTVSDITQQKLSELDISQVMENSREGMFLVKLNGEIVAANKKSKDALFGGRAEVGFSFLDFFSQEVWEAFLNEGVEELSCKSSEGGEDVVLLAKGMSLPSGNALLFSWYSVEERNAEQARLVQTDRLVSMGTMTATIGHEINNPLAYMRTNVDLLQDSLDEIRDDGISPLLEPAMEEAQESIDAVLEGITAVTTIVDDLRSFSRLRETQELKSTSPRRIADSSANMVMNELRRLDSFEIKIETERWACIDTSRMMQVLTNFLTNAALAVEDEERKVVTLCVKDSGPSRVLFCVEDNGCGIPSDKLESVFEPFYTKRESGKGTGLGLYICKSLVEAMGGTIWAESELGVGTTFCAEVEAAEPVLDDEPSEAEGAIELSDFVRAARNVSVKLLCVEEDDELRASLTRSYAKIFDVVCVPSARAAMALIGARVEFDAVLCSLRLREDSGLVLHDAMIEELGSDAPHFVFAIEDLTHEEDRALSSRSPSTLSKPVRRDALMQRILKLQDRSAELNSEPPAAPKPEEHQEGERGHHAE